MVCASCGKKEASVFLKQIVHNKVTQHALCPDCAQNGAAAAATPDGLLLELLAGLGSIVGKSGSKPPAAVSCRGCGLRYEQFKDGGRLGCADCYQAFQAPLEDLLQRVHGASRHSGKLPKGSREERDRTESAKERKELTDRLRNAVAKEHFEEAARLRDRLRRLET